MKINCSKIAETKCSPPLFCRCGRSTAAVVGVVAGVLMIFGFVIWWLNRDTEEIVTAEQAAEYTKLVDEAKVCLENEQFRGGYEQAEARYLKLKKELPDDLLAYRNQVILRVLQFAYDKDNLESDQAYIDSTLALVEELIEKEPDSFEPYLLAVRFRKLVNGGLDKTDIELLETACKNAKGSVFPFAEFYETTSVLDEEDFPGINEKRTEAIAKAYQLQKDNFKLASFHLLRLAENEDKPGYQKAWAEFKKNLGNVVLVVDADNRNSDRQKLVNEIDAELAKGEMPEVWVRTNYLWNIVKSHELNQIDQARTQAHGLDMLIESLGENVTSKLNENALAADPSAVAFGTPEVVIEGGKTPIDVKSLDYDLDEVLDVVVLYEDSLCIYCSDPNGRNWKLDLEQKLDHRYEGILVADLDLDASSKGPIDPSRLDRQSKNNIYADPDFALYGQAGIAIFENRMEPDTKRMLHQVNQEGLELSGFTRGMLVDLDHDKDLDMVLATDSEVRLLLNRGNMTFFDISKSSSLPKLESRVTSLDLVDIDRDIDIDVLIGFENDPPGYLENLGHAKFRFRGFDESFGKLAKCKSIMALEVDGKPSWDLVGHSLDTFVTHLTETKNASIKSMTSDAIAIANDLNAVEMTNGDFNNDGMIDSLLSSSNDDSQIILGNGTSKPKVQSLAGVRLSKADTDDFNDDGKLDLVAINGNAVQVLFNESKNQNNWLEVHVAGRDSNFPKGRINKFAIGSLVELTVGDRYYATTIKKRRLHFGLADQTEVDFIRILWTSGMPQSIFKPKSGQILYEQMFEKGSCPYIYTWNGTEYTFFSDCLWAAPLGLQYSAGQFIPCRNWEYLKIPGEILKPIDGEYRLQITEELREAAYFDLVKLYAVDHPADVEIFTNEKVGPGFIAQRKIHTVSNPRLPVAARDMYGNDKLAQIEKLDKKYFKGFKSRIAKGLTPIHYLELDLGELKSAENLTLFLHGWIRPTDCSLNISFSQNPDVDGPKTPVILVPNERGEWVKTVDPMGFPGGKPKMIAVDLSNAFLTDDYRLRIQTSHEIYWDQVFYTQNEKAVELNETELELKSANLHYRGFSERYAVDEMSPEWYDYSKVTKSPRWPAMTGSFTRYGDVHSLLTEKDDRLSVIGSGDEMTLKFAAVPEPPAGWKRDFVIHLIGYDKDGDVNTVTGQMVGPLPFDTMKSYPYGSEEDPPQSEKYKAYLKTYQTRDQRWGPYWNRLAPTD